NIPRIAMHFLDRGAEPGEARPDELSPERRGSLPAESVRGRGVHLIIQAQRKDLVLQLIRNQLPLTAALKVAVNPGCRRFVYLPAVMTIKVQSRLEVYDDQQMRLPGITQMVRLRRIRPAPRFAFLRQDYMARVMKQRQARVDLRQVSRITVAHRMTAYHG